VSAAEQGGTGGGGTARRKAARGSGGSGRAGRSPAKGAPSKPGASKPGASKPGASRSGSASSGGSGRATAASTRRALDPDALAALEEERDFLLRSLDDLEREHDAGDVDDTDYAELKDDYTARAAAVLRAIDDRRELAASAASSRSWGRTAGVLGIVAVLALGVGWFVFRDAGTRAPGQGLSGDARQDSANLVLQAQSYFGQARQALNDGDSQAAVDNFEQSIQTYDKALEISPGNAEAMAYRGWVLHNVAIASTSAQAAELDAQAMQWLDRAVAADPTFADARIFRAILLSNLGEYAAAQADLDQVDEAKVPSFMQTDLDNLRADVAAGLSGSTTTTVP
jgi:tetratricopeptide (TPR) repeat protein